MIKDSNSINNMFTEYEKVSYLNAILLDSLPHPALLINKNREVIAANKLAIEAGTIVGGLCWRDFGHCLYIKEEYKKKLEANTFSFEETINCDFCRANFALDINGRVQLEKKFGDIYWDIYWVPTKEDGVYLHYAIDITERKRIQNELEEINLKLKDAQKIAHFGNIEIDVLNNKVYWSDEVFRIFGYEPQEFVPSYNSYTKHFCEQDMEYFQSRLLKCTPSSPTLNFISRFVKLDGMAGWLDIKANTTFDEVSQKPVHFSIIMQDITDKKLWETSKEEYELNEKLLQKTLETDRLKTEFFTNVSHELRTPLNIIFSTLQVFEIYIRDGIIKDTETKISRRIKSMKQNCYRLLRLINNLIDMTKIDSGFIKLHPKNTDIINFVKNICLSVMEFTENRNLQFIFSSNIQSKIIACDPGKIEVIILNLISNAIKFNKPGGSISVKIQSIDRFIIIVVEDTGIGIPYNKQKRIFERFVQVNRSLARNYEGSGIGLSLTKSYVDMHGGEIWLESEYEKGSKFYVKLPDAMMDEDPSDNVIENYPHNDKSHLVERINIEFSDIYS